MEDFRVPKVLGRVKSAKWFKKAGYCFPLEQKAASSAKTIEKMRPREEVQAR